jgi:hypothetical protein
VPDTKAKKQRTFSDWMRIGKRVAIGIVILLVALGIKSLYDNVTAPLDSAKEFVGDVGEYVAQMGENAADTVEHGTATHTYELQQAKGLFNYTYSPMECFSEGRGTVSVTISETHTRAFFWTDTDTFSGEVPVVVIPCLYLDAVTVSPNGKTITVDASKIHFRPDPEATAFMVEYLQDPNPSNEGGWERFAESGWMPIVNSLQGLFQDPDHDEMSGLMIALAESVAANSTCIEEAWKGVEAHVVKFYEDQNARQHGDGVTVTIVGEPDLFQNAHLFESLVAAMTGPEQTIDVVYEDVAGTCEITFND